MPADSKKSPQSSAAETVQYNALTTNGGFSLHTEPLGSNTLNHCIQLNLVLLSECGIFDAIYIEQHNQNWDIKNLFGKQNQTNLWMSTVSTAFAGHDSQPP